jgi:hypothetical protein
MAFFLLLLLDRLAFAPLEFGAEDAEEAVRAVAEKADAGFGSLEVDAVVEFELHRLLTVYGEIDLVGDADDLDADGGFARDNDGADGEQVGTDGGDQHGVDAGHDNRPVGGEVIGG